MKTAYRVGIPALALGRGLAEAGFVLAVKAGLSGHESLLLLALIPILVLLRFVFQDRGAVLEATALRDGVAILRRQLLDTLRHRAVPAWRPENRRALGRALEEDIPAAAEGALARRRFLGSCLEGVVLLPLLFLLAWKAALVGVAAALLLWPLLRWRNQRMKALERAGAEGRDEARHAREDFDHALEAAPGKRFDGVVNGLEEALARTHEPAWRWRRAQARYPALLETALFFVLCVILFTGALTLQGLEPVLLFAMLLLLAYRPLREAARQYPLAVAGARADRDLQTVVARWNQYPSRALPEPHPLDKVTAREVTFGYEPDQPVLKNLSVSFELGQVTGISGPNGSGKTTLLRLLSTAEIPDGGKILWPEAVRAHGMVFMPQRAWPGHDWNVWADAYRTAQSERWSALDAVLGVERLRRKAADAAFHPEALSGGERQRMTLARVLASDAAYLLLDEPTTALPADERERVLRGALAFWKSTNPRGDSTSPRGALVVSHEPFLADLCDIVVRLDAASTGHDSRKES